MNEQDLIYQLLEKENLSEAEILQMNEILERDKELNSFVEFYRRAKRAVEINSHIPIEILADYVFYKSTLENGSNLNLILTQKIEQHLRTCTVCMEDFKMLNEEYSTVDNFVNETIVQRESKEQDIVPGRFNQIFQNKAVFNFVSAFAVLIIIYAGSVFITNYSVPEYNKRITELSSELSYNSRGRSSEEFLIGVAEIDKENYEEAIDLLNEDLIKNKDSKTIFYTHFILGQVHLKNTQKYLLGINLGIDKEAAEKSVIQFKKCIDANTNEQFASINYDSHYFMGRGFLLLGQKDSATAQFNSVIENRGKYSTEAEKLIREVESE
jgi:tetratricopeptide (TPR) repeat protein